MNPRATVPLPREWVREPPQPEEYKEAQLRAAQRVTGELLWLAQRSRLDIAFGVGLMASWVSRSPGFVVKLGNRVLEYLAQTKSDRLSLVPGKPEGVRIFTDASFAPHGEHSFSGVIIQYHECCAVPGDSEHSRVRACGRMRRSRIRSVFGCTYTGT